ncbi:MAG: PDZ domain-containing protein [Vicinamibacteria bacterium]
MRRTGAGMGAIAVLLAGGIASASAADKPRSPGRRTMVLTGERGRLGVLVEDVTSDDVQRLKLDLETGVRVRSVDEDSPAAAAGLKEDDVVLQYQGEAVHSAAQFARLVRETPVGRKVRLEIRRDGAAQQVDATVGERRAADREILAPGLRPQIPGLPNDLDGEFGDALRNFRLELDPEDAARFGDDARDEVRRVFRSRGPRLGIRYHELSDQLAAYFKVDDGVLVSSVDEGSPAARAGLKAGDVIVKLDGKPVGDASQLGGAVAQLDAGTPTTITVQRDGRPLDLKVTVEGTRSRRAPGGPTT